MTPQCRAVLKRCATSTIVSSRFNPRSRHDQLFRRIVERAGGLIEDQHAHTFVKRTGDANALELAAREPDAPLLHPGGVALRATLDEIRELRLACSLQHTLQVDVSWRHSERNVLRRGRIGEEYRLRQMGDHALSRPHPGNGDGQISHHEPTLSGRRNPINTSSTVLLPLPVGQTGHTL